MALNVAVPMGDTAIVQTKSAARALRAASEAQFVDESRRRNCCVVRPKYQGLRLSLTVTLGVIAAGKLFLQQVQLVTCGPESKGGWRRSQQPERGLFRSHKTLFASVRNEICNRARNIFAKLDVAFGDFA